MLARASAVGFEVSVRQLERWRWEGLLPRPVQEWVDGSPGSMSTYPAGSGDQLVMLCCLRRRFRRSQDIGWLLWWLGFSVDEKFWLGRLRSLAILYDAKLLADFRLATRGDRISNLQTHRTRNVIFRRLRKRIGPNEVNSVMAYLSEIISGQFEGWGASIASHGKERDKAVIENLEKVFDRRIKICCETKRPSGGLLASRYRGM
jgi:hypothetical protein